MNFNILIGALIIFYGLIVIRRKSFTEIRFFQGYEVDGKYAILGGMLIILAGVIIIFIGK